MVAGGERRRGRIIRVLPEARLARKRSTPVVARGDAGPRLALEWWGGEAEAAGRSTGVVGGRGGGRAGEHSSASPSGWERAEEHSSASAPGSEAACVCVGE
jgi:hypothetical protein